MDHVVTWRSHSAAVLLATAPLAPATPGHLYSGCYTVDILIQSILIWRFYCNSIGDIICNRGLVLYNGTIDDFIYNRVLLAMSTGKICISLAL